MSFPQIPVRVFYFNHYPLSPILKIAVVACGRNRDYIDNLRLQSQGTSDFNLATNRRIFKYLSLLSRAFQVYLHLFLNDKILKESHLLSRTFFLFFFFFSSLLRAKDSNYWASYAAAISVNFVKEIFIWKQKSRQKKRRKGFLNKPEYLGYLFVYVSDDAFVNKFS